MVAEGSVMDVTQSMIDHGIQTIVDGTCDAVVMSILIDGAGLNCQSMNRIIFMDPPTSDVQRKQAIGKISSFLLLTN